MPRLTFPPEFLWGTATSAAQIEGAAHEGGRGESIWDRFAAKPGAIEDGSDPTTACDHYHRWREDLDLLAWLGVGAYRFSIAWPRILPEGRGAINPEGLDFYERLVDGLLERGIQPMVTLYHWDLPQALQEEGGWANRSILDAFVDYADTVAGRLGDRVSHWVTHNEPWCVATLGHESGEHAPGHRDPGESLRVAHHLLLSHARAVPVLRARVPGGQVGIVLNLTPSEPATDSEADREAAREFDGFFNRWYLDPLFRGAYPRDAIEDRVRRGHLEDREPAFVESGDLEAIRTPIDFLGVNYYSRVVLRGAPDGELEPVPQVPPSELTDMGWEVYPAGLTGLLERVHREYAPSRILITENGCAYEDAPDVEGRIDDARRVAYLEDHVAAIHAARERGVPVDGYFHWSLLDNFEWGHGYTKKFGIFGVAPRTLDRTPKRSAFRYREIVAASALEVPDGGAPAA